MDEGNGGTWFLNFAGEGCCQEYSVVWEVSPYGAGLTHTDIQVGGELLHLTLSSDIIFIRAIITCSSGEVYYSSATVRETGNDGHYVVGCDEESVESSSLTVSVEPTIVEDAVVASVKGQRKGSEVLVSLTIVNNDGQVLLRQQVHLDETSRCSVDLRGKLSQSGQYHLFVEDGTKKGSTSFFFKQ